ncbi:MAG TPA: hypothetical protein VGP82_04480 [Ktedonobacterales bacterium]|nr:hypothetical protein [Ktedonobacterales bacterium]
MTGGWSAYEQGWRHDITRDETVIEHPAIGNGNDNGHTACTRETARPASTPHRDERRTPLLAFLRFQAGGIHAESGQRIAQAQDIHIETPLLFQAICEAPRCALRHGGGQQSRVRADMHEVMLRLLHRVTRTVEATVWKIACSLGCAHDLRSSFIRQHFGSALIPDTAIHAPDFRVVPCQAPSCTHQNGGMVAELPTAHMFRVWRELLMMEHVTPETLLTCSMLCAKEIEQAWIAGWLD